MSSPFVESTPPQYLPKSYKLGYFGIVQIVIGSISIIFNIVLLCLHNSHWYVSDVTGLWSGAFLILAGILSIIVTFPNRSGLRSIALMFNVFALLVAIVSGVMCFVCFFNLFHCNNTTCDFNIPITQTVCGVMMILMVVDFIIALLSAIYCGDGCCYKTHTPGSSVPASPFSKDAPSTAYKSI